MVLIIDVYKQIKMQSGLVYDNSTFKNCHFLFDYRFTIDIFTLRQFGGNEQCSISSESATISYLC